DIHKAIGGGRRDHFVQSAEDVQTDDVDLERVEGCIQIVIEEGRQRGERRALPGSQAERRLAVVAYVEHHHVARACCAEDADLLRELLGGERTIGQTLSLSNSARRNGLSLDEEVIAADPDRI